MPGISRSRAALPQAASSRITIPICRTTALRSKTKARRSAGLRMNQYHRLCRGQLRRCSGATILGESACQLLADELCRRTLDHEALHQVHQLAVAHDGDRGRGSRLSFEVGAGTFRRLAVLTGEDSNALVRLRCILHSKPHARPHLAGSAATNGIDNDHGRPRLGQGCVHFGRRACFLNARALSSSRIGITISLGTCLLLDVSRRLLSRSPSLSIVWITAGNCQRPPGQGTAGRRSRIAYAALACAYG